MYAPRYDSLYYDWSGDTLMRRFADHHPFYFSVLITLFLFGVTFACRAVFPGVPVGDVANRHPRENLRAAGGARPDLLRHEEPRYLVLGACDRTRSRPARVDRLVG